MREGYEFNETGDRVPGENQEQRSNRGKADLKDDFPGTMSRMDCRGLERSCASNPDTERWCLEQASCTETAGHFKGMADRMCR